MTTATSNRAEQPVFVFGALRSGTTLFRLMLNAHPGISNPGEIDFRFDYLTPNPGAPDGWSYDRDRLAGHRVFQALGLTLTEGLDGRALLLDLIGQLDVQPQTSLTLNAHRNADRIVQALPEARFIHLLRDPRDVGRSSVGMGWNGTSFHGVRQWIGTERGWDAASIDPSRVLILRYEDLMAAPVENLQRVCTFLNVDYRPEMLDYPATSTYGPPDAAYAEQWRRRAGAREIALIEGQCAELMTARGYALNGTPVVPGAPERMWLDQRNRFNRWRFNIRRYGFGLWASLHLSRVIGATRLHARLKRQFEERKVEYLK